MISNQESTKADAGLNSPLISKEEKEEKQQISKNEIPKLNEKEKKKTKKTKKTKTKKTRSKDRSKDNKNSSEDNFGLENAPLLLQPLDSSMKKKCMSNKKGKSAKKSKSNEKSNSQIKPKSSQKRTKLARSNSKPISDILLTPEVKKHPKKAEYSFASSPVIGRKEFAKSIGFPTKANLADQLPLILLDPSLNSPAPMKEMPKTPKPQPPSQDRIPQKKKRNSLVTKKKNPSVGDIELRTGSLEMRSHDGFDSFKKKNLAEKQISPSPKPMIPERLKSMDMHTRDTDSSDDELFDFGSKFLPQKKEIIHNEAQSLPPNKLFQMKQALEFQIDLIKEPNDIEIEKRASHKYDIGQLVKNIKNA